MVVYGLTVLVYSGTRSNSAVSLLLLTFLAPAVFFSAVAGVYVDRLDRRLILIVTNLLRAIFFAIVFFTGGNLAAIFILNIAISTVTTFFAPAEAAMIPVLVPRRQLLAANGLFTFTLNAAFALGFRAARSAGGEPGRQRGAHPDRRPALPGGDGLHHGPAVGPGGDRAVAGGRRARHRARRRLGVRRAARRPGLHPGPPDDHLVADLSRRHGVAHRRPGGARSGLRHRGPGAGAQGLRGRRPAARDGHRDRDPPAQQLRPAVPAAAADGGRPGQSRGAPHGVVRGRSDHPLPAAGRGGHAARPVGPGVAPGGRGRDRVPGRASPTRWSPSRPRPSSRRSSRRRSAGGSTASSTCSCRWPASCRSSSSDRSRTSSARPS